MISLKYEPSEFVRIVEPDLKGRIVCAVVGVSKVITYDVEYWDDTRLVRISVFEDEIEPWETKTKEPNVIVFSKNIKIK